MSARSRRPHAYRDCEAITRAQAANFYYGIRLLPRERRRAMCAVYAFARRVDDIGDGGLARAEKLRRARREARALATLRRRRRRGAPGAADPGDGRARRRARRASRCRPTRSAGR